MVDATDVEWISRESGNMDSKSNIEKMIRLYLNSDIDGIHRMTEAGDDFYREEVLAHINYKMARRMDSLSSIRSMVFAVGSAHLPSERGVINLLKARGFLVEPVWASKKLKPEEYTLKEVDMPWLTVTDDEGFYNVKMPGTPSDINMFGVVNMKMYYDIFKSTGYFTTAITTPYGLKSIDSLYRQQGIQMFGSKPVDANKIEINGIHGHHFEMNNEQGYRIGYLLNQKDVFYVAYSHAVKKNDEVLADMKSFLKSFQVFYRQKETVNYLHIDSAAAFSVVLPGPPQNADSLTGTGNKSVKMQTHIAVDRTNGAYFFLGISETKAGYYLENDSIYVEDLRESLKQRLQAFEKRFYLYKRWYSYTGMRRHSIRTTFVFADQILYPFGENLYHFRTV